MTEDEVAAQGAASEGSAWWDLLVVSTLVVGTPILILGINIRRGATAVGPIVLMFAVAILTWIVAALVAKRIGWSKALAVSAVGVIVFYNWTSLVDMPRELGLTWIPAVLVPALILIGGSLIVLRARSLVSFRMVALAMSAGSFIVGVPAIATWVGGDPDPPLPVEIHQLGEGAKPDVVVVVLDGYGRADVLEEIYGFDNTPMLSYLDSVGFEVADRARSNYSMTVASLSSSLSMAYSVPEGSAATERGEAAMHTATSGQNSFMQSFSASGYEIVYVESGWAGSRCGEVVDVCVRASLYDEMGGIILHRTPFYDPVSDFLGHPFTHNGVRVLEQLPALVAAEAARPRLIFAHSTVPHGPLLLREDCSVDAAADRAGANVGVPWMEPEQLTERRGYYVEQVRCVNSWMLALVEALDDDAIVLIVGDHGPDSLGQPALVPSGWTSDAAWERMSILTALRAPASCLDMVYPEITLINSFRLVMRCLGADMPFLEDVSYVYPHPPFARLDDGSLVVSTRLDEFRR